MVDCLDSIRYKDDFLVDLVHKKHDETTYFKDLTFTYYQYDLNDKQIFSVPKFDRSKISVERTNVKTLVLRFYSTKNHFLLASRFIGP